MSRVKIKDLEKFKEMWLNDEITPKEIANCFNVTQHYVHKKRSILGLSPKGTRGFAWIESRRAFGEENAKKVHEWLEEQGGFCLLRNLRLTESVLRRLIIQKYIFVVDFNFGRGTGENRMRKKHDLIFNDAYLFKAYACNSRTAIVKLMFQALKKPNTRELQVTLTAFLRRYLTDVERYAVLWKLGVRKWARTQVKSSVQIDGIMKPAKTWAYHRSRRLWSNSFDSQNWHSFWRISSSFSLNSS